MLCPALTVLRDVTLEVGLLTDTLVVAAADRGFTVADDDVFSCELVSRDGGMVCDDGRLTTPPSRELAKLAWADDRELDKLAADNTELGKLVCTDGRELDKLVLADKPV